MEFCSKYGYNYGFDGSESEDYSDEDEKTQSKIKRKIRKADSNIIAVRFDQLVAPNERFAGEPKACNKCSAVMSFLSEKNISTENEKIIWKCEFCEELNDMTKEIDDLNEIPKKEDVTFMLEVADNYNIELNEAIQKSTNDTYLAFCIDVSGSMNSKIQNDDNSMGFTRLMGVKGACMDTLKKLKTEEPYKQVAFTTFSSSVKYFGDCTKISNNRALLVIDDNDDSEDQNGRNLHNQERILTFANNLDAKLKCIKESYQALEMKVRNLRTEGSTALGPALLFSICFASKKPGSSIILCTDGCANVGLGSIDGRSSEINKIESEKFYDYLAEYAKEKGVTVNVISMKGTDCKLALLGRVADQSNGTLNIVNPKDLGEQFQTILENRTVATNVTAKLIVNRKYLYIRDDVIESEESKAIEADDENAKKNIELKKQSILSRKIGNVNIDTEITFEYGIRKIENENKKNLKELPFQVQISYTSQDGSKALRVYTKLLQFTTNRLKAESNIVEKNIFFAHNAQMMSNQVLSSNVVSSKYRSHASKSLINRNTIAAPEIYKKFSTTIQKYSKSIKSTDMDDEDAHEVYFNSKMTRLKLSKK